MSVGEMVAALDVGQSTILCRHLKILADVRFVLADHRGFAAAYYQDQPGRASATCRPPPNIVMGKPAQSRPLGYVGMERRRDGEGKSRQIISRKLLATRSCRLGGELSQRRQAVGAFEG